MRIQQCSRPNNVLFSGGGTSEGVGVYPFVVTDPPIFSSPKPEVKPYTDHAKATSLKDYWWLGPIPYWLSFLVRKPGK